MSLKGKSLHILTPMYGNMCTGNYHTSMIRLYEACRQLEIKLTESIISNESLISRARNTLADLFLKTEDAQHALFIDADIGFEPADVLAMLEHEEDILAAPCSKKNIRWDRVKQAILKNPGRELEPEQYAKLSGDFVFNFEGEEGQRQLKFTELNEMKHLGTGLMMIKRSVFERYKEKYDDRWYELRRGGSGPIWDFFRVGIDPETRDYNSEDYCFCMDCKAFGAKVWLCPWVRTTHVGSYTFVGDLPGAAMLAGSV